MLPFALALLAFMLAAMPQAPDCADQASCREAALEAASRGEFERFHDLAWRTMQRAGHNDPESMYLLARAQSLSGRPGDALVMLRRLADLGVAADAGENDDFRSVRALPGWPDLEARAAAAGGRRLEAVALGGSSPAAPSPLALPAAVASEPPPSPAVEAVPTSPATPVPLPSPRAATPAAAAPAAGRKDMPLRLTSRAMTVAGLAYDSTSQRFVLGDSRANKLVIADEVFHQVSDLIGAASGGFGGVTAVAIDSRRGDLWVTSNGADGRASVHKLQLVSGRVLSTIEVPAEWRPASFSDMSVTEAGTLLLLDSAGSRLLTMKPDAKSFGRPVPIKVGAPSSLAPAGSAVYVAHDAGLAVADLASGRVTDVGAAPGVTLSGLQRIRWHGGTLIAIQTLPETGARLVRIRLGGGATPATALEPLDSHAAAAGSALTISRDAAYFVTDDEGVSAIRRVPLR